jgi:glycosyltransferase involved in cell wall biosynthesis
MAMRRVLVVSRMFPHADAPCNGPFVHEQVLALRRQGADARVLCGVPFPMYLRRPLGVPRRIRAYRRAWDRLVWAEFGGVPVLYVPYHVGWVARLLRRDDPYRDAVVRGAAWLRSHFRFELLHAHTAHPDGFAALAVARQYEKPLVITEHTNPFSLLLREPTLRHKTLTALAAAERVWCVSDSLTREVRGHLPLDRQAHVGTLYNGVDLALFEAPPSWQPDPAAPRLLYVGFLLEYKNLPVLLEAFARLRQTLPRAQLTIAGDGPLRAAIEARIAALGLTGTVELLGQRSRPEVARLLRDACDLLVLPSKSETFGVVLIEALAAGKPVVASRCGGPESIVTEPFLGALCQVNDVESLADTLRRTAARLRDFDPRRIREHAIANFDYRRLAATLAEQYESVLATTTADRASRAA